MRRLGSWALFLLAYAAAIGYTWGHLDAWRAVGADALLAFFLLYMLVSVFPIPFKNMTVTLTPVVSLAAFLLYGVAVELWLTQMAILVSMLLLRFRPLERILLNLAMYAVVSITAAGAFFACGGVIGSGQSLSRLAFPWPCTSERTCFPTTSSWPCSCAFGGGRGRHETPCANLWGKWASTRWPARLAS